ncbi:hypothetical protein M434DRAFT_400570 [Hypoxylon sp. CO27-5]|nr:hypothetical protein M434DRAFT_400570 [Hypoxylon sp. CO27-5]
MAFFFIFIFDTISGSLRGQGTDGWDDLLPIYVQHVSYLVLVTVIPLAAISSCLGTGVLESALNKTISSAHG